MYLANSENFSRVDYFTYTLNSFILITHPHLFPSGFSICAHSSHTDDLIYQQLLSISLPDAACHANTHNFMFDDSLRTSPTTVITSN